MEDNGLLRKICCILLALFLLVPCAQADLVTVPTSKRFSLAHERLQTAIRRERPVTWHASVQPLAVAGYRDGALDVLTMMLSSLEASGAVLAFKDGGGYMQTSLQSSGREITSIGQYAKDDRTAINLSGDWVSIAQGNETEAAAMLGLDAFSASLLTMRYDDYRDGSVPFVSWVEHFGKRLWALSSPYARDNHGLSVPSGSTSHGTSYDINTQALRSVLSNWVQELTSDGLSIGLAGTGLSFGLSDEAFAAFLQRLSAFANTVEVSQPITFSLAFGEGDILRTAKGSGTLRADGKSTGVSYNYRSDLSDTKVTRSYNLDFQPTAADSLVLKCNWVTTSNNKSNATEELQLTASGYFDSRPYKLTISSAMTNSYGLGDRDLLTEAITGTFHATLVYDGKTVLDISLSREGEGHSYQWLTTDISITERYDVAISNAEGILFAGVVTLGYAVAEGSEEAPDVLETALRMEGLDFIALQKLRESMSAGLADARQLLLQAFPLSAMATLFQAH